MTTNDDTFNTLASKGTGGWSLNYQPGVLLIDSVGGKNEEYKEVEVMNTLTSNQCNHPPVVTLMGEPVTGQIMARDYKGVGRYDTLDKVVVYNSHPNDSRITEATDKCIHTLSSRMGTGGNNIHLVADSVRSIVRRLTPVECERLQGFPDGWTDIGDWVDSSGKKHKASDAPRYRALGNSIALPQWYWLSRKMSVYLPEHATLGSLFDGIGGFPLVWEMVHGKGTAKWASEIEEFPMAVTKLHFGDK